MKPLDPVWAGIIGALLRAVVGFLLSQGAETVKGWRRGWNTRAAAAAECAAIREMVARAKMSFEGIIANMDAPDRTITRVRGLSVPDVVFFDKIVTDALPYLTSVECNQLIDIGRQLRGLKLLEDKYSTLEFDIQANAQLAAWKAAQAEFQAVHKVGDTAASQAAADKANQLNRILRYYKEDFDQGVIMQNTLIFDCTNFIDGKDEDPYKPVVIGKTPASTGP